MNHRVTIDGVAAPASFAAHIERDRAAYVLANGCYPCVAKWYADRPHGATCLRRAVAEALFGWLGGGAEEQAR